MAGEKPYIVVRANYRQTKKGGEAEIMVTDSNVSMDLKMFHSMYTPHLVTVIRELVIQNQKGLELKLTLD